MLRFYLTPEVARAIVKNYPGHSMSLSTLQDKLLHGEKLIYDETTCVELHKLLIATLVGYGKNLKVAEEPGRIRTVYSYSLLLWEITLCCPVCWVLIKILRGDYDGLEVRGRHSMLYAFELPKYLPQEVLNALQVIQRFRQYLQTEFQLMISKWQAHSKSGHRHHRTPSALSDSAVSVARQSRLTTHCRQKVKTLMILCFFLSELFLFYKPDVFSAKNGG